MIYVSTVYMYDVWGSTPCAGVWCCVVQDCYVVIQKTTQIMMDRLRQILAVDAVSCSQVIIAGARVYKYAGGAANCLNWYNVKLMTYIVYRPCA